MERKKKKLSVDHQDWYNTTMTAVEQERIQQLFSKKFVYSHSSHWTLKSTTMFGQLMEDSSSGESCQDFSEADSARHETQVERKAGCTQHQGDSCGGDSFNADMENSASAVIKDYEIHLSPLGFDQPDSLFLPRHLTQSPSHSHNSYTDSSHSLHGNTNRIQQKAAQLQQQLERTKVVLPPAWQHDVLMRVKENLNTLKDKLSDKEMIDWHQHTNSTNLAGKVVGAMKSRFNAELCTQAWCKFHEILAQNEVVPSSVFNHPPKNYNSIHLCEAPGAFITSLNHYLVSRGFDTHRHWRWLGTTLNPYYEGNDTGRMISDDRFIRTTFSNWFFGHDNSGDLMSQDNMVALMDCAAMMGDIHLITADGSIDCQENPAEQEVIVSRLHHCEVLCSCMLLAPGGTLVIKLFTMLEASSIALLYFLNCTFEKVTVCKPATSKSGNSEVYAVCSGYTAPLSPEALFSVFSAVCASEDPHIVLLPRADIPPDFLEEHVQCCLYFCQLQSATITQNLALYGAMEPDHKRRLTQLQDLCTSHYIFVCGMAEIGDRDRIRPFGYKSNFSRFSNCRPNQDRYNRCPRSSNHHALNGIGSSSMSLPLGRLQGTFQERQQQNQFPWQQLLAQIPDYFVDENCSMTIKCRQMLTHEEVTGWNVKMGRVFSAVASSHFCDSRMLGDLQLLMTHAQVEYHQQKALAEHSSTVLTDAFRLLQATCFFSKNYHNPGITITALYHLAMEASLTSFWPAGSPELCGVASTFPHHRLSCVEDLRRLEEQEQPVGVVVDVTRPPWLQEEEVQCQRRLLEVVLHACSYLPQGSTLVLILPVALTRLTAGLLYIFAGLFHEMSFAAKGRSPFLHQTLCFHDLTYPDYSLLHLLETLRHAFASLQTPPCKIPVPEKSTRDGVDVSLKAGCCCHCRETATPGSCCHGNIDAGEGSVLCDDGGGSNNRTGECQPNLASCRGSVSSLVPGSEGHQVHGSHARSGSSGDRTIASNSASADLTNVSEVRGVENSCRATFSRNQGNCAPSGKRSQTDHGSKVGRSVTACHETTSKTPALSGLDIDETLRGGGLGVKTQHPDRVEDVRPSASWPPRCDTSGTSHLVPLPRPVPQAADSTNDSTGCDPEPPPTQRSLNPDNSDAIITAAAGAGRTCNAHAKTGSGCRHPVAMEAEGHPSVTFQREGADTCVVCVKQHAADGREGGTGRRVQRSEARKEGPAGLVPVELVPVLEIINDVTFTRFLQASNRLSISSFVSSIKAAECDSLANQQTPQQSAS